MNREELNSIAHFIEINGMMDWPLEEAINEYLTTKQLVEDYDN